MSSRNNLLRRLAGASWGASPSTLRTGALALVYSAAEYASPAWCRSAHAKKLDITLNETMRIVTGCLKPTPTTEFLPVLSGIAPAALRRENYTHRLVSKASQDPNHLLHKLVSDSQDLGRQRLPSRRSFSRHSSSTGGSDFNTLQAWRTSWQQTPRPPQLSVTPNTRLPPGADLPRKDWATLNRLYGLELADSTPICTAGACAHQQPAHAEPRNRPPITSSTSAPTFPHPTIWTSKTQTLTQ